MQTFEESVVLVTFVTTRWRLNHRLPENQSIIGRHRRRVVYINSKSSAQYSVHWTAWTCASGKLLHILLKRHCRRNCQPLAQQPHFHHHAGKKNSNFNDDLLVCFPPFLFYWTGCNGFFFWLVSHKLFVHASLKDNWEKPHICSSIRRTKADDNFSFDISCFDRIVLETFSLFIRQLYFRKFPQFFLLTQQQ